MTTDNRTILEAKFSREAITHMNIIHRNALHMAKNENDAEDLVQQTYLKAYRFFDKFNEGTNCKAWLLTILRNSFINAIYRGKKYSQTMYLSEMDEYGMEIPHYDDPEDIIFGDLFNDDVNTALDSLPARYRTIVLLADIERFSYRDIADKINCPIGTVMSRLSRGRRLLRKKLKAYALKHGYKVDES